VTYLLTLLKSGRAAGFERAALYDNFNHWP
jgi:hypothetical protein